MAGREQFLRDRPEIAGHSSVINEAHIIGPKRDKGRLDVDLRAETKLIQKYGALSLV